MGTLFGICWREGRTMPGLCCWRHLVLGLGCLGSVGLASIRAQAPALNQPFADATRAPQVEIGNGVLKARLYLPDIKKGYYRGTRFDWSGVIGSLEYKGHNYYGPWFARTDATVNDFVWQDAQVVAGPCSA